MKNAKSVNIPMMPGERTDTKEMRTVYNYSETVGNLLYASNKTRPDIAFSVNFCSRYMTESDLNNANDLKHILRYLRGNSQILV